MDNPIVVYDACVLYPAPLRDLLMHLAQTGLYQAKWTEEIHREWMRNLLKNRPDLRPEQLERTRRAMDAAVSDCLVEGYESRIGDLTLPDAEDRHVLAAIHASASLIVTFNLTDFPAAILSGHGVRAEHPDEFIKLMIELDAERVAAAAERQRRSLRQPPKTREQYLETLWAQGLPQTAERLRELLPDPGEAHPR